MAQVDGPAIVDDTSLCFNALNGMPGAVFSFFINKFNSNSYYLFTYVTLYESMSSESNPKT